MHLVCDSHRIGNKGWEGGDRKRRKIGKKAGIFLQIYTQKAVGSLWYVYLLLNDRSIAGWGSVWRRSGWQGGELEKVVEIFYSTIGRSSDDRVFSCGRVSQPDELA